LAYNFCFVLAQFWSVILTVWNECGSVLSLFHEKFWRVLVLVLL
jgi:hypothetical protein